VLLPFLLVHLPAHAGTPADQQIRIEGGTFTMGCDREECTDSAGPSHPVSLDPFWIGKYEITQAQWAECVSAGLCTVPLGRYEPTRLANWPVVGITREDAKAYCAADGARLPTEAEWERAATGTTGRLYAWGNETPDCTRAQLPICGAPLGPVGTHPAGATPEGVFDLVGNAWEFVSDYFDPAYYRRSPSTNPTGADAQFLATVRGPSSWTPSQAQVAFRLGVPISTRSASLGFRCAGSVQ
jgi:formylglycine-generating enzyme required for sulfatase activity